MNVEGANEDIRSFNQLFRLKAQAEFENIDLPIQKEVKVRYEMDLMNNTILSLNNSISQSDGTSYLPMAED